MILLGSSSNTSISSSSMPRSASYVHVTPSFSHLPICSDVAPNSRASSGVVVRRLAAAFTCGKAGCSSVDQFLHHSVALSGFKKTKKGSFPEANMARRRASRWVSFDEL